MKSSNHKIAENVRLNLLKLTHVAKSSHLGSSLSIVEILTILYNDFLIKKNDFFFASKKFSEAELNFEKVEFAAKSSIMSSFSLYGINFYEDALERIKFHRERGDEIIIASASLDLYVCHFASHLGFDNFLATETDKTSENIITGKLKGPNLKGEKKLHQVKKLLNYFLRQRKNGLVFLKITKISI